jgi:hypothetical protein
MLLELLCFLSFFKYPVQGNQHIAINASTTVYNNKYINYHIVISQKIHSVLSFNLTFFSSKTIPERSVNKIKTYKPQLSTVTVIYSSCATSFIKIYAGNTYSKTFHVCSTTKKKKLFEVSVLQQITITTFNTLFSLSVIEAGKENFEKKHIFFA